MVGDRLLDRREDPVEAALGKGGGADDGRPRDEPEFLGDVPLETLPIGFLAGGQVPFVEHNHARATRLEDLLSDALIVPGHPFGDVHDENGHIDPAAGSGATGGSRSTRPGRRS